MDAMGIGASGARAAVAWAEVTADNIANVNTPESRASSTVMKEAEAGGVYAKSRVTADAADLVRELPNLMPTKHFLKANTLTLRAAAEIYRDMLNLGR